MKGGTGHGWANGRVPPPEWTSLLDPLRITNEPGRLTGGRGSQVGFPGERGGDARSAPLREGGTPGRRP
jgi:hypothetical protein